MCPLCYDGEIDGDHLENECDGSYKRRSKLHWAARSLMAEKPP